MLPTRRRTSSCWLSPLDFWSDDLGRFVSRWCGDGEEVTAGTYPVDVHEDENHIFIDAELPGFTKDEMEVTFENGVLSIHAEHKSKEKEKGQAHLAERRFTRVARNFALPTAIDEDKIRGNLDNGVLHLTLDKREEVKPRRIMVT